MAKTKHKSPPEIIYAQKSKMCKERWITASEDLQSFEDGALVGEYQLIEILKVRVERSLEAVD